MTTEELLLPRYKVIADYPGSIFKIGEIIEQDYMEENRPVFDMEFFLKYPNIFKKLEWWEDRKIDDLPEYVKFIRLDNGQLKVVKVTEWIKKDNDIIFSDGINFYSANNGDTPATREEYEQYQQSIK